MANDEAREAPLSRDDIRGAIFGKTHKPKQKQVTFFGQLIEIRQSTLGDIIAATMKENREAAVVETLIGSAYVPGTNDKVFEEGDRDALLALPFGKDFAAVNQAMLELTDVNFLDKGAS